MYTSHLNTKMRLPEFNRSYSYERDYTPLRHPPLKNLHFCCGGVFFLLNWKDLSGFYSFWAVVTMAFLWDGNWMNSFAVWSKTCASKYLHMYMNDTCVIQIPGTDHFCFFLQDRAAVSTWEVVEGGRAEQQAEKKSWSFILGLGFFFQLLWQQL